jgi:hypothetical protein
MSNFQGNSKSREPYHWSCNDEEVPMLRKGLHLSSAGGVLVRGYATNFGGARCLASTIRGLSVRGLPKERSSKGKVSAAVADFSAD